MLTRTLFCYVVKNGRLKPFRLFCQISHYLTYANITFPHLDSISGATAKILWPCRLKFFAENAINASIKERYADVKKVLISCCFWIFRTVTLNVKILLSERVIVCCGWGKNFYVYGILMVLKRHLSVVLITSFL